LPAPQGVRIEFSLFGAKFRYKAGSTLGGLVVERFGRLDILVNNAGTTVRKLPQDLSELDWQTVIDTNLTGAFRCAQAAFPFMQARGWLDTELTQSARQQIGGLNDAVLNRTPAKRWGVPEDMAGPAVFLASDASNFVTGACLAVDGGYSVRG